LFHAPLLPSRLSSIEFEGLRVRDLEFDAVVSRGQKSCHIEITRRSGPMQILVVK